MGGACGYGNLITNGYGTDTAALSSTIFSDGYACGQCYQIRCFLGALGFHAMAKGKEGSDFLFKEMGTGVCDDVAGAGDIHQMWVKGTKTGWISMSHNWGASYQAFATLQGQSLSFS
ncbi:hypothetical protein L1987_02797 [Smallanthus sonchifolius]|uniref:Uncharacterized protein n=1 Tax=Smallanthus sonchifolius TaxID=185202 RepID=A0ACB9K8U0_9ASTR|nr:hypothetical protein L1987_02797 [Smallanthus sonchifolius]